MNILIYTQFFFMRDGLEGVGFETSKLFKNVRYVD